MSSFENNDMRNTVKTTQKNTENNHSCNTDFACASERRYTLKEFFRIIAEDTDIPEKLDDKMRKNISVISIDKKDILQL